MMTEDDLLIHEDPDVSPLDMPMLREMIHALTSNYPGWDWVVEAPPRQNVVIIRNLTCDPRGKMGMVIYKSKVARDSGLHATMAGGELLERYRQRRAAMELGQTRYGDMLTATPDS